MATNQSPGYIRAEEKYRSAKTDEERLEALQEMLSTLPKHKASEKLQADLKTKISKLRKEIQKKPPAAPKGGPDPYHVPKGGAGQVVLIGTPNVGKSAIVAITTNAPVKVADYPYTTAVPAPGMWPYEDVQIQLVDTPPMTADHVPSGLMGTVRSSDVIGIVVDLSADPLEQAETVLKILADRGLELRSVPRTELDKDKPAQHVAVLLATKVDLPVSAENLDILSELYKDKIQILPISALSGQGLDQLCRRLWELLGVIRIYTKEPGKPVDRERPYVLPVGSTLTDLAASIHRDLPTLMKYARVWGDGRFAGAQIQRTEVLRDKDVVEIHS